jgi:hypothetical protein
MIDLSPEEILRMKEEKSGIKFDQPENLENLADPISIDDQLKDLPKPSNANADEKLEPVQSQNSIGKSQMLETNKHASANIGWKNMPVDILPSRGMFYPEGTRMAIRPADVKEIRHFSTIDEEDRLDIEEKLGYVLDRCLSIEFPNEGVVSYRDLKSEDRFFLIIAIRDLTFVKGENSVILFPDNVCENDKECPLKNGFELRTGVLSSYNLDPEISKYYDSVNRCFTFSLEGLSNPIKMYVPSIGVTQRISEFTAYCLRNNIEVDDSFLKISPFLFDEWRVMDDQFMLNMLRKIDYWSKEEFSLYFVLSEKIKIGTKPKAYVKCPKCGGKEVPAEISFPYGIRSLFVISDIIRKLL